MFSDRRPEVAYLGKVIMGSTLNRIFLNLHGNTVLLVASAAGDSRI